MQEGARSYDIYGRQCSSLNLSACLVITPEDIKKKTPPCRQHHPTQSTQHVHLPLNAIAFCCSFVPPLTAIPRATQETLVHNVTRTPSAGTLGIGDEVTLTVHFNRKVHKCASTRQPLDPGLWAGELRYYPWLSCDRIISHRRHGSHTWNSLFV